jgi:hypothetical protein
VLVSDGLLRWPVMMTMSLLSCEQLGQRALGRQHWSAEVQLHYCCAGVMLVSNLLDCATNLMPVRASCHMQSELKRRAGAAEDSSVFDR